MNLKKRIYSDILSYLFIICVVIIVLDKFYEVDLSNLIYPLKDIYAPGDGRHTLAFFKMVMVGDLSFPGFVFQSKLLSAPLEFNLYDFPMPFFAIWLYIMFLSLFSQDPVVVFNIFYLSSYFISSFTMYYVLRKLRVNIYLSVAISLLYTFLPFHFWRLPHTFYGTYFFIPIWAYFLLLLHNKKPLFFKRDTSERKYSIDFSKKNIIIFSILLISSTWNFYFTFFFAGFILMMSISSYIYNKTRYHIYSGIIFFMAAVIPFGLNMLPYKIYEIENGKNISVAQRDPISAETLGYKIAPTIFPVFKHQNETLSDFSVSYHHQSRLFNESNDSTLGVIGAIGFLILIGAFFFQSKKSSIISRLSKLNMFGYLVATVGGFGTVFAYLVTPQIRGYNRISMFMAAFAFITIALVINRLINKKVSRKVYRRFLFIPLSLFIIVFGIWDMTSPIQSYKPIESFTKEYISDKNFIEKVEKTFNTKENIMVAQYPYINYPEHPGINKMGGYEQFYGYIFSDFIHWSVGSVRGRNNDSWWYHLNEKPLQGQIKTLETAGFSGLMINRNGYKDNGEEIEKELIKILNVKPIVSENKKISFFKLTPKGNEIVLEPIFKMFYPWEGGYGKFRWATNDASIDFLSNIENKKKEISFSLGTLIDREIKLEFNGKVLDTFTLKAGVSKMVKYDLVLDKGNNKLKFITDKPAITPPNSNDTRLLSFSISNFIHK